MRWFRTYFKIKLIGVGVGFAVFVIGIVLTAVTPIKYTEITDIDQYGNYTGTNSDSFTNSYINAFFPEKIEESFSDVKYSYKAENTDTYGFEAYLEFTIEDEVQFRDYISRIASTEKWKTFVFDPSFQEYSRENVLLLDIDDKDDPSSIFYLQIICAKVSKVLYSPESQTIIYYAMGVYDGGGIGTNYFNTFFERFQIDPIEYVQTASDGYGYDPFGIS